jgi:hypothetical protein
MSTKRPPIEDLVNERPPIEELQDTEGPSTFQKTLNVIDIVPSVLRTGAEAALSPEREMFPEMGKQIGRIIESPTTAAAMAPTGRDVNQTIKTEVFGETPEERAAKEKDKSFLGEAIKVASDFTTETALTGPSLFSSLPKINKITRIPLVNIADRQAAKSLANYATKTKLSAGKDIRTAGARLVEENLQGLLRNPVKLYEKLTGETVKITKTVPDGLDFATIKNQARKKGLIKEASDSVDALLSSIEKDYEIEPILPSNLMMRNLLERAKKNISPTSGETVDLDKVESILQDVLKPYTKIEVPGKIVDVPPQVPMGESDYLIRGQFDALKNMKEGGLEKTIKQPKSEIAEIPNKLTLSELQKLRKNIGKQVSDLTFYATSDKNVTLEKDTLASLYRELGEAIKSQLSGRSIIVGNTKVKDAAEFYENQNNRLKQFLDIESLLEYVDAKELKNVDLSGKLMGLAAQAPILGGVGLAGSMFDMPIATGGAVVGAGLSAARTAGRMAEEAAPEYLSSIFKQASRVPSIPYSAALAPVRGTIQYMRQGQPVSEFGREPQSVELSPKDLIKYRIPRSTQGILENKEKVLAKLSQQGVPKEMIHTVAQAMNGEPDDLSNVASIMVSQFPDLFEKSRYMIFDGKFLNPNDKAKAADDISKRDNLDSIQRAKMISKINKTGEVPEGM